MTSQSSQASTASSTRPTAAQINSFRLWAQACGKAVAGSRPSLPDDLTQPGELQKVARFVSESFKPRPLREEEDMELDEEENNVDCPPLSPGASSTSSQDDLSTPINRLALSTRRGAMKPTEFFSPSQQVTTSRRSIQTVSQNGQTVSIYVDSTQVSRDFETRRNLVTTTTTTTITSVRHHPYQPPTARSNFNKNSAKNFSTTAAPSSAPFVPVPPAAPPMPNSISYTSQLFTPINAGRRRSLPRLHPRFPSSTPPSHPKGFASDLRRPGNTLRPSPTSISKDTISASQRFQSIISQDSPARNSEAGSAAMIREHGMSKLGAPLVLASEFSSLCERRGISVKPLRLV
ncbi:hypothetical protein T439DRAFT_324276 [Meredithblackwellia eburnea MCA 4105]